MILAERAARMEAEAAAARARAANTSTDALIARLKLEIEKLRRELYGTRSERKARLLDQLEMQLEDLEADATEDELAAEAAARSTSVVAFQRRRSARKPFPASAARTHRRRRAGELPVLRLAEAGEARRGRHRDDRNRLRRLETRAREASPAALRVAGQYRMLERAV